MGMKCALYTELLAHSSMSDEEYHFMASASGLVYIMASMLWEGMSRGRQLYIAFHNWNSTIQILNLQHSDQINDLSGKQSLHTRNITF